MKQKLVAVFLGFGLLFGLAFISSFTNISNIVLSVQPQFIELQGASHGPAEIMWMETNKARARYGLRPVALDAEMSCRAWEWAQQMRMVRRLYHSQPWMGFAEIIMVGASAKSAVGNPTRPGGPELANRWLTSPGHRAIVLGRNYKRMGAAKAGSYTIEIFSTRTRNLRADCLLRHGLVQNPQAPYTVIPGA